MFALPHWSLRAAVGVGSGCLAVVAWRLARSMTGFPDAPRRWLSRLVPRAVDDVRRRDSAAGVWTALALWSVAVSVLHFAGVTFEVYAAVSWWDLLTHGMSGVGIAAVAAFSTRAQAVGYGAVWWIVPTVLAVGAGFEVYEFLFKRFWHEWTLRHYAVDTVVDLCMNTLGATLVAVGVTCYRAVLDRLQPDSPRPGYAG
jgi:hypothetical protein